MPDGFDDILAEHRAINGLLDHYRTSGDDATAHAVCEALAAHGAAEDAALYPRLRPLGSGEAEPDAVTDGIDLAERAQLEHADLGTLAARVLASPPGDLGPVMEVIGAMVESHFRYEEHEILPRLRPVTDPATLHRALTDAQRRIRERSGPTPS